jgi:hypothetical protein
MYSFCVLDLLKRVSLGRIMKKNSTTEKYHLKIYADRVKIGELGIVNYFYGLD